MDESKYKTICKKLDTLIALISIQNVEGKEDKIYLMKKLGMTSEEIGSYLGIKNVRVTEGWKRK